MHTPWMPPSPHSAFVRVFISSTMPTPTTPCLPSHRRDRSPRGRSEQARTQPSGNFCCMALQRGCPPGPLTAMGPLGLI